jgi:Fe-S cluster biogenesis protein NfuA
MLEKLIRFPLFKDFSSADLKIIAPLFHARTYPQGAVIIEQGEKATCLFLLTNGEVDIRYKPYDGETIKVTHLRVGGVFGWSAVLGNPTYSSSVICTADCEVLEVCGADLRTLKESHPQTNALVMDRLTRAVSSRWPSAQTQVKSMLNKGITENVSPLWKGTPSMNTPAESSPKDEQLKVLLDQLSAYIEQFHGGSVEYVDFDGITLKVRLGGACLGCPLSPSTLHGWVEGTVRQFFPDIENVEAV